MNREKRNLFTFLTGAGISGDSGIPTYRSIDGIWVKGSRFYKPEEFGTLKYFKENQEEVWQYCLFRKKMFEEAEPNESHRKVADIENLLNDRFHLITQNIDGLHLRAGSKRVYEIHGNNREVKCSNGCKGILPWPKELRVKDQKEDLTAAEIEALKCANCGHWMRPNILWFDEYYDERTNKKDSALKVAKNIGVLFIVGTSGATTLPLEIAKSVLKYGGYVIDINTEDNQFTKLIEGIKNKLIIRGKSSEALPMIRKMIADAKGQ
jgi:NAD-dependent deacetylase